MTKTFFADWIKPLQREWYAMHVHDGRDPELALREYTYYDVTLNFRATTCIQTLQ
jgi:hypothetical protein